MKRLTRKSGASRSVATIAGVALAVVLVPGVAVSATLIGTAQLKDGAVTSAKIRDGAVHRVDLAVGARPRLPRAVTAANADNHGVGVTAVVVQTISLPTGRWQIFGKGIASLASNGVTCDLVLAGSILDRTRSYADNSGSAVSWSETPLYLQSQPVPASGPATASIRCVADAAGAAVRDTKIVAIEVR